MHCSVAGHQPVAIKHVVLFHAWVISAGASVVASMLLHMLISILSMAHSTVGAMTGSNACDMQASGPESVPSIYHGRSLFEDGMQLDGSLSDDKASAVRCVTSLPQCPSMDSFGTSHGMRVCHLVGVQSMSSMAMTGMLGWALCKLGQWQSCADVGW